MANPVWEDTAEVESLPPTWEDTVDSEKNQKPANKKSKKTRRAIRDSAKEPNDNLLNNAFMQNFADSGSFGFRDEAQGAIGALLDAMDKGSLEGIGENYRGLRDISREDLATLSEESPGAAIAGQVAGFVGPAGLASAGLKAVGRGASSAAAKKATAANNMSIAEASKLGVGEVAAIGASEGAIMGAGGSEADSGTGLVGDVLAGAAGGAAGGAIVGLTGKALESAANKLIKSGTAGLSKGHGARIRSILEGSIENLKASKRASGNTAGSEGAIKKAEDELKYRMMKAKQIRELKKRRAAKGREPTKPGWQEYLDTLSPRKKDLPAGKTSRDIPGSIPEARISLKDLKKKVGGELTPEELRELAIAVTKKYSDVITGRTVGGTLKETIGNMGSGVKRTVNKIRAGDYKALGPQAAAGIATGSILGPVGGVATALGAGALQGIPKGSLKSLYNVSKLRSGLKLERVGKLGPTKAAAAAKFGSTAAPMSDEDRTKDFLEQQRSAGARKRMRRR